MSEGVNREQARNRHIPRRTMNKGILPRILSRQAGGGRTAAVKRSLTASFFGRATVKQGTVESFSSVAVGACRLPKSV